VSIIGILIAIALPRFSSIQKDAQISQVKNTLATIIKECNIAQLRGKSTLLGDIKSAKASLPGYLLESNGFRQGTSGYNSTNCFRSVQYPAGSPRELGILISAEPTSLVPGQAYGKTPFFMIIYKTLSGELLRYCEYQDADPSVYPEGCTVNQVNPRSGIAEGTW
jgi:type II secretory pathway pseudopilin PulG